MSKHMIRNKSDSVDEEALELVRERCRARIALSELYQEVTLSGEDGTLLSKLEEFHATKYNYEGVHRRIAKFFSDNERTQLSDTDNDTREYDQKLTRLVEIFGKVLSGFGESDAKDRTIRECRDMINALNEELHERDAKLASWTESVRELQREKKKPRTQAQEHKAIHTMANTPVSTKPKKKENKVEDEKEVASEGVSGANHFNSTNDEASMVRCDRVGTPIVARFKYDGLKLLKKFDGKFENFFEFKDNFMDIVRGTDLSDRKKLTILQKHLDDDSREMIKTKSDKTCGEAIMILVEHYSNLFLAREKIVESFRKEPKVKSERNIEAFRKLVALVNRTYESLVTLKVDDNYLNFYFLQEITDKVPESALDAYIDVCYKDEPVGMFIKFLTERIKMMERKELMLNRKADTSQDDSDCFQKSFGKSKPYVKIVTASGTNGSESHGWNKPGLKCHLCDGLHRAIHCDSNHTPQERNKIRREKKLCALCLARKHATRECRAKYSCTVCGGKHAKVICFKSTQSAQVKFTKVENEDYRDSDSDWNSIMVNDPEVYVTEVDLKDSEPPIKVRVLVAERIINAHYDLGANVNLLSTGMCSTLGIAYTSKSERFKQTNGEANFVGLCQLQTQIGTMKRLLYYRVMESHKDVFIIGRGAVKQFLLEQNKDMEVHQNVNTDYIKVSVPVEEQQFPEADYLQTKMESKLEGEQKQELQKAFEESYGVELKPKQARGVEPINQQLANDPEFQYDPEAQIDFDPNAKFVLMVTANQNDIDAVLKQQQTDGRLIPVGYFFKEFLPHQLKYSIEEKACLALVEAIENWHFCLIKRFFRVVSDYIPFELLRHYKCPMSRIFNWNMLLSQYDFLIEIKSRRTVYRNQSELELRRSIGGNGFVKRVNDDKKVENIMSSCETYFKSKEKHHTFSKMDHVGPKKNPQELVHVTAPDAEMEHESNQKSQVPGMQRTDSNHYDGDFEIGDSVYLKSEDQIGHDKLNLLFKGPYENTRRVSMEVNEPQSGNRKEFVCSSMLERASKEVAGEGIDSEESKQQEERKQEDSSKEEEMEVEVEPEVEPEVALIQRPKTRSRSNSIPTKFGMLFPLLTLICVAQSDGQATYYEKANPVLWRPTQIGVAENVLPAVTVAECENYRWCQQIYYGSIIDTLRRNCPRVDNLKVLAPLSSTAVDRSKRSMVAALEVSVVVLVVTAAVGIAMAYNKANEATEKVSKVEQDFAVNLKLIKDDNEMSTGIHQRMEEVLKKMSQEMEVIRFDHTLDQVIQQVDSFEVNKRDDANNELLCVYDFVGPVFIMYDHSQNCSKNLSFNLRTENEYLFVYDSNRCYQRSEGIVHWRKMNCLHEKEVTDEQIVQIETDAESKFVHCHRQILEVESMMAEEYNNTVYKLDKRIAVSVNEIKLPVESNAAVAQLDLQPEVMSYLIGLSFDIVMKGNEEWNSLEELIRKKQKSNEAIKSASFQVIYAFDIYVISTAVVLMLSVIAVLGYFQCEKQERLYEYRFATRGVELTERQRMGQPPSI